MGVVSVRGFLLLFVAWLLLTFLVDTGQTTNDLYCWGRVDALDPFC